MGGRMGDGVGGDVQVGKHMKNGEKSVWCSAEEAVERPRSVRPVGRHTYAVVGQDSGSRGLGVAGCGWGCSVWCRGRDVGCLCDFSCFCWGRGFTFWGRLLFFIFGGLGSFLIFLGCPHFILGGKNAGAPWAEGCLEAWLGGTVAIPPAGPLAMYMKQVGVAAPGVPGHWRPRGGWCPGVGGVGGVREEKGPLRAGTRGVCGG